MNRNSKRLLIMRIDEFELDIQCEPIVIDSDHILGGLKSILRSNDLSLCTPSN